MREGGIVRRGGRAMSRSRKPGLKAVRHCIAVAAVLAGLSLTATYDFLLFHSLAEIFSVVIAAGIFMIAWNSREFSESGFLLFLGICLSFVAAIDVLHMLAYEGMGVFGSKGADLPTQLWIAARGMEALALLLAPFAIRRKVPVVLVVSASAGFALLLLFFIFVVRGFPHCYVGGALTPFKVGAEIGICLVLAGAGLHLTLRRKGLDGRVFRLVLAAIVVTILSEIAFLGYRDVYGVINQVGHLLKILAFYLIYRATIQMGLRRPYGLLFRELKQSEESLSTVNRELDRYARTVSHDLRGPIAGIAGANDAIGEILDGSRDAASLSHARELCRFLAQNVEDAVGLVDRLLVLARAGRRPPRAENVDVRSVVDRIVDQQAEAIAARAVSVDVEGDLGVVRAEPTHVYQVFSNLITNAVRHGDRRGLSVRVRRTGGAGSGRQGYRVADDGRGLPETVLETALGVGSGIGLTIVSRLVALYGGEVTVWNDPGAVIEFSLPVGEAEPAVIGASEVVAR